MKFISNNIIKISKDLSDLDLFCLDFVKILRKHINYVIISGYVSILLGRSRSSEDIDILVPKMSYDKFLLLFEDLKNSGFYCLNAEYEKEIYSYLTDKLAVRFAKNNKVIPNIELNFAKNEIDTITLQNTVTVKLKNDELIISQLELQIVFKEIVLKSPKDMEDAEHIRNVAKGNLNMDLIKKYEKMLNEIYR